MYNRKIPQLSQLLAKALRNERRKCRREGKADDRGWKKGCFVLVLKKKTKNTLILFLRHSPAH